MTTVLMATIAVTATPITTREEQDSSPNSLEK